MSEIKSRKRKIQFEEANIIKRIKLNDDSTNSENRTISSCLAYSPSDSFSDQTTLDLEEKKKSDLSTYREMESEKKEKRDERKEEKAAAAPSQGEIDEFFTAAERFEQKRFTEKYNYDVVNDTPLQGRYQWVCLKP